MRRTRPRDLPPLPWVSPDQCVHPSPVALLKFQDSDETLFRCKACGEILHDERPEKQANMGAGQTTSGGDGSIRSWLDDETSEMYSEWKSAGSELERRKLCLKWRLDGQLRGCYSEPP